MITTLITLAILALLILGHELGHFLVAKLVGIRVDEFGIGFPPRLFAKKLGETEYSLNLLPFGGFVKVHGEDLGEKVATNEPKRSFSAQPYWKKFVVITAGVLMNFIIGWFAFAVVIGSGLPGGVYIDKVAPDSPADVAGFHSGELITGFANTADFISYVNEHVGEPIEINGRKVTPRENPPAGQGALGVAVSDAGFEATPFPQNIWLGLKTATSVFLAIFAFLGSFLWGLFTGNFAVLSEVSGPVGVFAIAKTAAGQGALYLTQLVGVISLNLAVLNIIPFPALDGGRLLFVSLRRVFGERVFNGRMEMIVNTAGFVFLLALMILVTVRDIMNL